MSPDRLFPPREDRIHRETSIISEQNGWANQFKNVDDLAASDQARYRDRPMAWRGFDDEGEPVAWREGVATGHGLRGRVSYPSSDREAT